MADQTAPTQAQLAAKEKYKGTEKMLGIASTASVVMSFIPGVNLAGAALQGWITSKQYSIDLETKGAKAARKGAAIGGLLTAASLVPFLGAAGKAAKLATVGADTVKLAETGATVGKAAGTLARAEKAGQAASTAGKSSWLGKTTQNVTAKTKEVVAATGTKIKQIPGATQIIDGTKKATAAVKTGATKVGKAAYENVPLVKSGHQGLLKVENAGQKFVMKDKTLAKAATFLAENPGAAKAIEVGAIGGSVGLSIMGDVPPGSLLNSQPPSNMAVNAQGELVENDAPNDKRMGAHTSRLMDERAARIQSQMAAQQNNR